MDDYKNTKEGRVVGRKYADILQMARPEPSAKHPRMPLAARAKIFSPFAALRGFDDELAEEGGQALRVEKADLSDEEQAALAEKLAGLARGSTVTVRYFVPDRLDPSDPPLGRYETVTGAVRAVDRVGQTLRLGLDAPPKGPGVEKEKALAIPLGDIEALT